MPNPRLLRWLFLSGWMLFSSSCFIASYEPPTLPYKGAGTWLIDAQQALTLHQQGAIFLDVRDKNAWLKAHIQHAQHTTWQTFSEPTAPGMGRLLASDAQLTEKLQMLGISKETPVVVFGDPIGGWGEDGRLVWMLKTLGHTKSVWVDGGHEALVAAGLPTTTTPPTLPKGTFVVARRNDWDIQREALKKALDEGAVKDQKLQLIDTREQREYEGSTPYGERRGGHLAGAIQLHYKELLNTAGFLLPKEQLLALLKAKGLDPTIETIAYCTGGVRSGWFVSVLLDLGFKDVKNYAGSMWEWSAGPATDYPLFQSKASN